MTTKALAYGRDLTDLHLDQLRSRAYEGVATFPATVCKLDKGYPLEGEAGILTIYSDDKDRVVFQQITFFTLRTYFRSGKYDTKTNLFSWGEWSYYLTIHDLQKDNRTFDLDDVYMTQDDFNSVSNIPDNNNFLLKEKGILEVPSVNKDTFDPKIGFELFTYKYEGTLKDNTNLLTVKSVNTLNSNETDVVVGYYDRSNPIPNEIDLTTINAPSRRPGILEVFSQFLEEEREVYNIDIEKTLIFTEYETGDIYVTHTVNNKYDDYSRTNPSPNLLWYKYSCDSSLTQSLNKKVIDFFDRNKDENGNRLPWINPLWKNDLFSIRGYKGTTPEDLNPLIGENISMVHSGLLSWEVIPQYSNTWISKGNTLEISAPENGWIAALVPAGTGYIKYSNNIGKYINSREPEELCKELIRDYSYNILDEPDNRRSIVTTIMNSFGWYYSSGKLIPQVNIGGDLY